MRKIAKLLFFPIQWIDCIDPIDTLFMAKNIIQENQIPDNRTTTVTILTHCTRKATNGSVIHPCLEKKKMETQMNQKCLPRMCRQQKSHWNCCSNGIFLLPVAHGPGVRWFINLDGFDAVFISYKDFWFIKLLLEFLQI